MGTTDSTTKACRTCGNIYPATPDYFRRYAKYPDGLTIHCKQCLCKKVPRIATTVDVGIIGAVGIPLTKGYIAIVDEIDGDLGSVLWKASVVKGRVYACRYKREGTKETLEYLHRVIYERILDRHLDRNELVDHHDNDPRNNRRENLRLADHSTNGANRKMSIHNTTSYKGTVFKGTSWYAVLRVRENTYSVGGFATEEEAHAKYCELAVEHFGEFARFE